MIFLIDKAYIKTKKIKTDLKESTTFVLNFITPCQESHFDLSRFVRGYYEKNRHKNIFL